MPNASHLNFERVLLQFVGKAIHFPRETRAAFLRIFFSVGVFLTYIKNTAKVMGAAVADSGRVTTIHQGIIKTSRHRQGKKQMSSNKRQ